MRRITLASVGLALLVDVSMSAQQRSHPVPMPRPAPVAPLQTSPPPDSRFTSTLIFRGQRNVVAPALPFQRTIRGVALSGLPFFWGWGVPAFYLDSPPQAVPLPADAPAGGVQLDVTPWRSSVYVDGVLKGRVDEFRGYYRPLTLPAGVHEIAIVERGYQPLIFEVMVTPGRTQTYRAALNDALAP